MNLFLMFFLFNWRRSRLFFFKYIIKKYRWLVTDLPGWPCPFPRRCSWSTPPWSRLSGSGWELLPRWARTRSRRLALRSAHCELHTARWTPRWTYLQDKNKSMVYWTMNLSRSDSLLINIFGSVPFIGRRDWRLFKWFSTSCPLSSFNTLK